jgi:hypothetical protein
MSQTGADRLIAIADSGHLARFDSRSSGSITKENAPRYPRVRLHDRCKDILPVRPLDHAVWRSSFRFTFLWILCFVVDYEIR